MDAVGVADEVVIEAVVALLPRELPQGYIGHTWNGNDRNPPGFGWNYTRQVCLLDVDSLGRVVMEALGEGETFNKRFPLKESLVPPGARKEKLVPPTRWPHLLNTNQDLIYNKTCKKYGKPGIWTKVGKKQRFAMESGSQEDNVSLNWSSNSFSQWISFLASF